MVKGKAAYRINRLGVFWGYVRQDGVWAQSSTAENCWETVRKRLQTVRAEVGVAGPLKRLARWLHGASTRSSSPCSREQRTARRCRGSANTCNAWSLTC